MMAKCVLSHGAQGSRIKGGAGINQDLEDKLYQMKEQNVILKREAHNANYQVKCLNTKLTRLINEKKKLVREGGQSTREVELEELIFNMNTKVDKLMRENEKLHHHTLLLRTQLQPRMRKSPIRPVSSYTHVRPRVDSGLDRTPSRSLSRNRSVSMTSLNTTASKVRLNERNVTFDKTAQYCPNGHTTNTQEVTRDYSKQQPKNDTPEMDAITFRLLTEARQEIETLEEVVANQQSFIESRHIKSISRNGCEAAEDKIYAQTALECSSSHNSRAFHEGRNNLKSEQTQTELDTMSNSVIENRKGHMSEMMTVYLSKLEQELRRAREEMSDIQEQLIVAKMNSIKVDELNRKVNSLQKENAILQESISSTSSEMLTDQQEKSLLTLQRSLKHYQAQVSSLEEEKRLTEMELTSQRERVRNEIAEKFELKSLLNEARYQIEDLQNKSSLVPISNRSSQCDHRELTAQLFSMEQERNEFLNEFTEMKQMLELIHNSIEDG